MTPYPDNFLNHACKILLPSLQRLRILEVINQFITSKIEHIHVYVATTWQQAISTLMYMYDYANVY